MRLTLFALPLLLAACGAVSPAALLEVSRLDPLTADPSRIAARVDLPAGLQIPEGAAVMILEASRSDTGQSKRGIYALVEEDSVWRLSPADAAAFGQLQSEIAEWKADVPNSARGSLTITVEACTDGPGPARTAPVSVDLSLDGGTRFIPFLRNLTVADVLGATDANTCPQLD